jgi:HPt (histidine-containing phosphotransfer) domain-containing protein
MPDILDLTVLDPYRAVMGDKADEFVAELIDSYFVSAPDLLNILDNGLTSGNIDEFVRAAHTLKATSRTLGAKRLATVAYVLEQEGRNRPLGTLTDVVAKAHDEYAEVEKALREARSKLTP